MNARLQANLDAIISNLGDDYVNATQNNIAYRCPFCEADGDTHTDRKLYVSYDNMKYLCFRCGRTGKINLDDGLASNTDFYKYLAGYMEETTESDEDEEELFFIPKYKPVRGSQAYDYIISRGISEEAMEYYDIRVPSINQPHLFGRFIIPNQVQGKVFTDLYMARTYINDPVRYKNSQGAKRNQIVFNLHRIPDNPDYIIIQEGALNAIIAGKLSVATMGKFVSEYQIQAILRKNPKMIICSLDTDAYKYTIRLCKRLKELRPNLPVYIVNLPEGKDAGDLKHDLYWKYVVESTEYVDYSTHVITNYFKSINEGGDTR